MEWYIWYLIYIYIKILSIYYGLLMSILSQKIKKMRKNKGKG